MNRVQSTVALLLLLAVVAVYGGQVYRRNLAVPFTTCASICQDYFTITEHFPIRKAYMKIWITETTDNLKNFYMVNLGASIQITLWAQPYRTSPNQVNTGACYENVAMAPVLLFIDESDTPPNTCWRSTMRPYESFTSTLAGVFSDSSNWGFVILDYGTGSLFIDQYEIGFNYNEAFTGGDSIIISGFNGQNSIVQSQQSKQVVNLLSTSRMQMNAKLENQSYKQVSVSAYGMDRHITIDAENDDAIVSIVDQEGKLVSSLKSGEYASLDSSNQCQIQRFDSDDELFSALPRTEVPDGLRYNAITAALISCMGHEFLVEVHHVEGEERRIDIHATDVSGEIMDGLLGQTHVYSNRYEEIAEHDEFIVGSNELLGTDYKYNHFK